MKTYDVIINNELVANVKTLKQAWQVANELGETNYEWEDVKEQYQCDKECYKDELQDWKDDGKLEEKPVFDFVFWLKPYNENTNHDRIKEVTEAPQQVTEVSQQTKITFSAVFWIVNVILALLSGGVSLAWITLPWVIAKYQTNNNESILGIIFFSWLYNIYRMVK